MRQWPETFHFFLPTTNFTRWNYETISSLVLIYNSYCPTSPFTVLEPQNPWIDEFYVVQKRLAPDFKAPKSWKGSSGGFHNSTQCSELQLLTICWNGLLIYFWLTCTSICFWPSFINRPNIPFEPPLRFLTLFFTALFDTELKWDTPTELIWDTLAGWTRAPEIEGEMTAEHIRMETLKQIKGNLDILCLY